MIVGAGGRTVNALPDNPYASASQALIDYLYVYYNEGAAGEPLFTTSNLALPRARFRHGILANADLPRTRQVRRAHKRRIRREMSG